MRHGGMLGMSLLPAWRGRGLGERLIRQTLEAARAFGFSRVELTVRHDNARAQALYRNVGFEVEGRKRRAVLVDGVFYDLVVMALLFDAGCQTLRVRHHGKRVKMVAAAGAASSEGVRPGGSDTTGTCLRVLATAGFADYALLDSGNGRKLERFGRFTVDRPEPQAMWQPALEPGAWLRADAHSRPAAARRTARAGAGTRTSRCRRPGRCGCSASPCSAGSPASATWASSPSSCRTGSGCWSGWARCAARRPRVLNLFAYTGAASLIAAHAGAEVTHVDASKRAIAWAKQNQAVSQAGRGADPLDPRGRAQVRGPRGAARQELPRDPRRSPQVRARAGGRGVGRVPAPGPAAARLRAPAGAGAGVAGADDLRHPRLGAGDRRLVRECLAGRPGTIESGELAVVEEAGGRLLPTSLFTPMDLARCRPLSRRAAACAPSPACRTSG